MYGVFFKINTPQILVPTLLYSVKAKRRRRLDFNIPEKNKLVWPSDHECITSQSPATTVKTHHLTICISLHHRWRCTHLIPWTFTSLLMKLWDRGRRLILISEHRRVSWDWPKHVKMAINWMKWMSILFPPKPRPLQTAHALTEGVTAL